MGIPLPPPRRAAPPSPRRSPLDSLLRKIRRRLLTELHVGTLRPGERLPSIRQTARENDVDHRLVARAYRVLESESLVEVRGRSGVYIAHGAGGRQRGKGEDKQSSWIAEVLAEAWRRNLTAATFRDLMETYAEPSGLVCACVESNIDQMTAYRSELSDVAGISTIPIFFPPTGRAPAPSATQRGEIEELFDGVDLVITTHYHSVAVRSVLSERDVPVIVLRINATLAAAVRAHLSTGPLTVIACTREFGDRIRMMYRDAIRTEDQLRLILVDHESELLALDPHEPVLVTRAARARRPDLPNPRFAFPHSPTIADETLGEISEAVVRLNLTRAGKPDSR